MTSIHIVEFFNKCRLALSGRDFCRARALGAATDFEAHGLAVFKGGVAFHLDFGVVDKEVFAAVLGGDESVAFY